MQGSVSEVKIEIVHKDGEPVPMVMNALRREHEGMVVHEIALYVARDRDKYERELVTSRKKLEAVLAEATRLQEEAKDRALFAEQMVGIVSHDLRNPLSTIHMGAALLKKSELSLNQLAVVGRLTRAAERANRLIGDLLDFTQARVGKGLAVTRKPIDLHKVVAETLDELALAFPSRRIVHEKQGEGFCAADPDRLAQLLGNLVANAMTYGIPETPVTVTSSVIDHSLKLAVHNEGPQIPVAMQAELFKPMARGDVEGSPARSVGLGLFIVSEIAKSHGGRVSLDSGPGGTTFTVTLPRN
jgi:sigma-B regulation protein RsbU (phosphoserine phosphatase)